jgi:hypothetical protein
MLCTHIKMEEADQIQEAEGIVVAVQEEVAETVP